ncbi:hypothetical protein NLU66_16635 [Brachybacterium sp. NBEC-018]|uniref:hypothetical protein n=1 Tax=Brachybacterium sp. NBEC-018 TaxID=2996004 RepID=UPI00217546B3|nr:hypothetical protein [Brachybacterium sp. NBEC-018]UVY83815.1 hypothetical protein NLU66_16635 [Brachybacterium sp. NBEC-018]
MKRAIVAKYGFAWHVCHVEHGFMVGDCTNHPTHADALAHALAAVGLTEKEKGR